MTQLASTTLSYDQIYFKIRDFFIKSRNNTFKTLEDESEAYGKLLRDIFSSIGSQLANYDPYIKGEPPRSAKINTFSKAYADDLNILGKQIDFLSAKTVNIFNMFSTEIENEKKYLERVGSKITLLQMYSRSPGNNLYYFGDSFDNMDKIDISKIKDRFVPLVLGGQCTLPLNKNKMLRPRKVYVNKTEGFLGNYHKVNKIVNSDGTDVYRYVFEDIPNIGSLSAVGDSNPLSFVEFEVLNVDRSNLVTIGGETPQDWEFNFLDRVVQSDGTVTRNTVSWADFDMSDPLRVSYIIEFSSTKANAIEIVPYFGSNSIIKVTNIKLTKKDGSIIDTISSPFYIGSTASPVDVRTARNYFYNKATIKFTEVDIIKAEVFFEQETIEQIDISHVFWRPNYPIDSSINSPFYGLRRFNPDSLNSEVYEEIEYNLDELVPESDNITKFKNNGVTTKAIPVRLKTRPVSYNFWVISFEKNLQFDNSDVFSKSFFNGWKTDILAPDDGFNYSNSVSFNNGVPTVKYYSSEEQGVSDLMILDEIFQQDESGIISIDGFDYEVKNLALEQVTYTNSGVVSNYLVPLISDRQILPAKRKSIGIRDISIFYESYSNKAEVVSKIFNYDKSIESIALSIDSNIDNSFLDKINLNYYISVVDGKWIPISPIQLDSRGIAEIIFFNKNISESAKLPGAAYLNYPNVPKDIRQVRVKIEMIKNREINATPILYSYELIAKVVN